LIFLKTNESADFVMNSSIYYTAFYYVQISDELSRGIFFTNSTGSLENKQYPLMPGTSDNNAIWNYNKTDQKTEYWIYFFVQNTEISLCQGALSDLCSKPNCSGEENYAIPISNAKWSKSYFNDQNNPSINDAKRFVIGFDNVNKIATNVQGSKTIYLRYWLDVPAGAPAYVYNTTYQIMAVVGGYDC
jgi:hypothetical protein